MRWDKNHPTDNIFALSNR